MTATAKVVVRWPTEEMYEDAGKALASAYNQIEAIVWELRKIVDDGELPENGPPTAETVGLMWSFLDGLRVEIDQFERYAKDLDRVLGQTNAMRLEEGIRHAS